MQFGLPLYDALCARGRSASVAHIAHGAAAAGLRLHAFDAELGASCAIVQGMNAAAGEDIGAEAGQSAIAFANEMAREALLWETAEIEAICAGFSKVCVWGGESSMLSELPSRCVSLSHTLPLSCVCNADGASRVERCS